MTVPLNTRTVAGTVERSKTPTRCGLMRAPDSCVSMSLSENFSMLPLETKVTVPRPWKPLLRGSASSRTARCSKQAAEASEADNLFSCSHKLIAEANSVQLNRRGTSVGTSRTS